MEKIEKLSVKEFMDKLYSSMPAPGGGSAAALGACIGAALAGMVFNLTTGKKFYNEYDDSVKEKINKSLLRAGELKDEFLELMDEDINAFNKVMAAFKLPKESEEEKDIRSRSIQEAYKGAMEVPLKMARKAIEIFDLLEISAKYGNPNAISDAGVGALFALSALESAVLNVRINLAAIKDRNVVDTASRECEGLLELAKERKERIIELVEGKL
ncbi:cyclodeaminase/cyclohydrolase family protein [Fonticella tunisiensis]|uniref:Formiminotetrahydrofolate cyclodeaminase n=1 Tax=Fonticella tunisiensis TaxID=1096341 RepID=A0A4R7K9M9_9CLOT|nr:cyclodeaminase/cyclohydrolase family protein [Fonticella tunisiensis]TDT50809.1 formiminotetrahydrofolate cyclodeaminase [Fonticella tunisiensis]